MKRLFNGFYEGKKVFVTGHTGFKGSWLCRWLSDMGARVKGYALPPQCRPNLFDALGLAQDVQSVLADIRDFARLQQELADFQPDAVFHLAAQPLVRASYARPRETFDVNVTGTLNLLEALRALPGRRAVVNVTTDKVYQNEETGLAFAENAPLGGKDPYSASKAGSEIVTASYRESFFNPADFGRLHETALASARAGNVIGGGDWAEDRLLPDAVRAFHAGHALTLRNPHAVRPWQYVLEPLAGYLLLASKLCKNPVLYARGWNFGPRPQDEADAQSVALLAAREWGNGRVEIRPDGGPREAGLLRLNSASARGQLGWKNVFNVTQAVTQTVRWYKDFYAGKDPVQITRAALAEYARAAAPEVRP